MSEIVALSFDSEASPAISLTERGDESGVRGWGLGWYPGRGDAALVLKDPNAKGGIAQALKDWDRLRSTTFLSLVQRGEKPLDERDLQPFVRTHAGRQWLFAHVGELTTDLPAACPLDEDFEPLGRTDSEHAFCWLLSRIREGGVRSLAELNPQVLRRWLRHVNDVGTASFAIGDGKQLAVYRDVHESHPLYWIRRLPPHEDNLLESYDVSIDLDAPLDPSRTSFVVANHPMSSEHWLPMEAGQLMLVRRGAVVWSSHPDPSFDRFWSLSAPGAGASAAPAAAKGQHEGAVQGQALVKPRRSAEPAAVGAEDSRVVHVVHETRYRYELPVERSSHRFRLRPVEDAYQQLLDFSLEISVDGQRHDFEDVFGNDVTSFEIHHPFDQLVVRAEHRVRLRGRGGLYPASGDAPRVPTSWMPWQRQMMEPYLLPPELPESQLAELDEFARSFAERNDGDLVDTLLDMNRTLYRDFRYVSGSTEITTSAFEVYTERRGVCQDFANLMICLARLLHVPARYRMGYIFTGADYSNRIQSEASHAWVELFLPRIGWRGFDPTNGCQVRLDHVRVAAGRNYLDATPTSGTIYKGGAGEALEYSVRVETEAE